MLRILLVYIFTLFHPVHVSLTSVDYDDKNSSFNVFIRLYYDDFLKDYQNLDRQFQEANPEKSTFDLKSEMERYLSEKLIIKADDRNLKGRIDDIRLEGNEVSMNLSYLKVKNPGKVVIRNSIMTGLYNDMANMVILRIGEFEKGVKMTAENTEESFIVK